MPYCIIISGPTASGKTSFSIKLAEQLLKTTGRKSHIVNADIGQFYTPLSIGTAKPDWKNEPIPHHLFDVIDTPTDLNVVTYRNMVIEKINEIWNAGDLPIIVGGSLFYIRSLFFPPRDLGDDRRVEELINARDAYYEGETQELWNLLQQIDPERAKAIHPNDRYRIERALAIWGKTGRKPSSLEPIFEPPFHSRIIFIDRPREVLFERINTRTREMILDEGWSDEAKALRGSAWETFLKQKKLIGYPEIFEWLGEGRRPHQGRRPHEVEPLIKIIQQKTRQYAKRQITFWKKFHNLLIYYSTKNEQRNEVICEPEVIHNVDKKEIQAIIGHISEDLQKTVPKP